MSFLQEILHSPVQEASLYSGSVDMTNQAQQKPCEQMNMLGKLLWHQFTTMVMLKQNMRQQDENVEDQNLRQALGNMGYGSCTPQDVKFLRSQVIPLNSGLPDMSDVNIRNVSIITPLNVEKDRLNEQGCIRFAKDTNQELHHFYSIDTGKTDEPLPKKLQQDIWKLPPSGSDYIPGRLSLCKGMPVIIWYNHATELCITRGQEAHVVGWTEKTGYYGQRVLEVLFILLWKPPTIIQIPNLPDNVVPILKQSAKITVKLPSSNKSLNIS